MNINEISVYGDRRQMERSAVTEGVSLLGTGKKERISGQEGVLFGGKDSVLSSGVMNGYDFLEQDKGSAEISQAQKKANENLAVLSGEDCKSIEEDGDSLIENTREYVENAVKKNRERKADIERNQEKSLEQRARFREEREQREALGFAELKSEAELRGALEEVGIAVTPETLEKVSTALTMCETVLDITDQTKAFLIRNDLEPSLEHLYQGKYMVQAGKETGEQDFESYHDQIEHILQDNGMDTDANRERAHFLFTHELPVNAETLEKLSDLERISREMTPARAFEQILFAMSEGMEPKDALLDDRAYVSANEVMEHLEEIKDEDIVLVSEQGKIEADEVSLETLKNAAENERHGNTGKERRGSQTGIPLLPKVPEDDKTFSNEEKVQITLKRQLEEIRQKMTLKAAVSMEKRGIHVETEPLEKVIGELRQMENAFAAKQIGEGAEKITEPEFLLLQETLEKTNDISNGFAGVLGGNIRQHMLLTVNELHAAVSSEALSKRVWTGTYETVQTQVRADLGDSIKKAFEGIPDMLESMGLEDTEANERAVRILGYNRMEITEENIQEVKIFDAKVNQMISGMKPATVLELIRRGENPLNTPLGELNEKLKHLNEEKNVTEEEKYSKYLWMLEKDGQISEEERSGYIGVYRLLHQIEKSDGAVIGALMESGRELTLGNLLTQVRIKRSHGINAVVDDTSGAREAVRTGTSISEQIERGFAGNAAGGGAENEKGGETSGQEDSLTKEMTAYYQNLVSGAREELWPSKLQEMTDGDLRKLLGLSVERFAEELKKAEGNQKIKTMYYEALAEEIRNGQKNTEAAEELLAKLFMPETVGNLIAAKEALNGETDIYKEVYVRRKHLDKRQEEEFEKVIDELPEAVDSPEILEESCLKAEKIMQEILTKSHDSADITFKDLQQIRQLGRGLRLQAAFRESKSYDIPIRTGDTITSLNLTIVRGTDESGRIQISMEDESFGRLSLDFKVGKGAALKGLVLCSERKGFDTFMVAKEDLAQEIGQAGFVVKNISYGMDFKSRNERLGELEQETEVETKELYRLAKVLVRQITKIMQ